MKRKEINELWKKTEKQLKDLGGKIALIAGDIKKDAIFGAKVSRISIEKLNLELKKKKILTSIGDEVYKLYRKGKVKEQAVAKLCKKVDELNRKITKKNAMNTSLKKGLSGGGKPTGGKTRRKKAAGRKAKSGKKK